MQGLLCYVNGKIEKDSHASLPISDLGIQRGYGIFDFFRVRGKRGLFLDEHLDRLFHSAEIMRLDSIIKRDNLKDIIDELINRNSLDHSGMKILITAGDGSDGYTIHEPRLSIVQNILLPPPDDLPIQGIRLACREYQRQLAEVKTTDYLMAIWLQPWMKEKKADDILYHQNGSVSECPRSNIFIITKDLKLVTPNSGMLAGITRKNIIKAAVKLNLPVEERTVNLNEVVEAAGAFICSTTKRMMPVCMVNDISISLATSREIMEMLWQELLKMEEAS
jgi:D-alanine transaminase/branched-chain amino acid aminotransferase